MLNRRKWLRRLLLLPATMFLWRHRRLASAKIGTAVVASQSGVDLIKTTGEIKAAETKIFHINSLVVGRVVADKVNLGDVIHQGQTLAVVQNLDVTKIAGEYIHQLHQNEVQQKRAGGQIGSG